MKKLFVLFAFIGLFASCTPEATEDYDIQAIDKDEIKDDDI